MLRRLWLCVPSMVFAFADYLVTMGNQPARYWAGDYDAAIEGNPLVRWCMTVHPWMFHGLTAIWIAAFVAFIVKTPRVLARFAALAVAFSHAFCIGTWLHDEGNGFLVSLALCIACAVLTVAALELSGE